MKIKNIKTTLAVVGALLLTGSMTTSCVKDLDVENINPQQVTTLDADALFNKLYSSLVLTGQKGPDGMGDLDGDEGRSQYYRMIWNMNELTTDEAHWYWYKNDLYEGLEKNSYGADDAVSSGLYYRLYFTITLCNFYLDQVKDDGTAETKARRAEARFLRAYTYYNVMDLFGNATFTETVSNTPGQYYTRKQFFDYVEKELKECSADMKEAGQNTYGRVDKVAAWLLLSRLYLNAEVYAGEAKWKEAKEYAKMVIDNNYYHLMETTATNPVTGEEYNAYQMLFLADNDTNGAQYEAVFPVIHDGLKTKSYGGMHALILGSYNAAMSLTMPSGTSDGWGKCACLKGKLVKIFLGNNMGADIAYANQMGELANDGRALFISTGYSRDIENMENQDQGYSCVKFRNVRSDGKNTSTSDAFVDTDLPLMRIAEAYLNYAEATARTEGINDDVIEKINALRNRAKAQEADKTIYTLDNIRDEWAKEFWFEGRRRMDLVRFNSFGGQSQYKWDYMGGAKDGQKFAATRNIFGIPSADLINNPNLKQNTGY